VGKNIEKKRKEFEINGKTNNMFNWAQKLKYSDSSPISGTFIEKKLR